MTFREKSAWAMVTTLILAYGAYLVTVISRVTKASVAEVAYQGPAVIAAIAVVVLAAGSHVVLAAQGQTEARNRTSGATAIARYARSAGGVVVSGAAVLGMALAMVEADHFWIANVIIAGLVSAEVASAGSEIRIYRRQA